MPEYGEVPKRVPYGEAALAAVEVRVLGLEGSSGAAVEEEAEAGVVGAVEEDDAVMVGSELLVAVEAGVAGAERDEPGDRDKDRVS